MQAIQVSQFGGPDVLELSEIALPQPRSGEVLVRVLAARRRPLGRLAAPRRLFRVPALCAGR